MLSILTGEDVRMIKALPVSEFNKLAKSVKFIYEEAKPSKIRSEYTINDHRYICKAELAGVSTGQYIDYQTYAKMTPRPSLETFISLWLIPKGHMYNDGYDMEEVKKDILDMPVVDALGIQVFIVKQLVTLILITVDSLKSNLKKMGMNPKTIEEATSPLLSMASSLWSSVCASSQSHLSKGFWNGLYSKLSTSLATLLTNRGSKKNK